MTEKISDENVLFPEVNIDGIIVKPWSFGILFEISSSLESILDKAEESGLVKKMEESGGFLSYTILARLFTVASPHVLKVMSITLGKSEEEIKSLDMATGIQIATTIYNQNKATISNSLKNVFGPPAVKEKEKEKKSGGQK
jgi:hypothetical protein